MRITRLPLIASLSLLIPALCSHAFDGHRKASGPLTMEIADVATVSEFDTVREFTVTVTNTSESALGIELRFEATVEECIPRGPTRHTVELAGQTSKTVVFQFSMATNAHSALYPLHVFASGKTSDGEIKAHVIQIFSCDFSAIPTKREMPPTIISLPPQGSLGLASLWQAGVAWQRIQGPLVRLPTGWQGSDRESSAHFGRGPVDRGQVRQALQIHPPYRGGPGTLFAEYRLKLPATTPIELSFHMAIRDHSAAEPPSDGVTFRVWVGEEKLFERHTTAKRWEPGRVDLSRFSGEEIILRLECHPGPKNDTTCDSAYWGDPVIAVGSPPHLLTSARRSDLEARTRVAIQTGNATEGGAVFELHGGMRAAVYAGPNGITDGILAFGSGDRVVTFEGMNIQVNDRELGAWPEGVGVEQCNVSRSAEGTVKIVHRFQSAEGARDLIAEFWSEGSGLRLKITGPGITDLALGRASHRAGRVYYGHGYCVVKPGKFVANGGGHDLSTSHVGFEFDNGVFLLNACDTPPGSLRIDPVAQTYALHTHPDTTFTFVPTLAGAWDAALKYRPLYDKSPAPAIRQKAGRFVFDLWGGSYAENTRLLRRCFDYGLTNSLAIIHVWQRWGYDYRLPDIFPPNPDLGTVEELAEQSRVCRQVGVLWGLHDNYIDIYPDATGFNYDQVTFNRDGQPRKAWLNEGRNAQSYQFRPDRVRPFLEHNLALIQPSLQPNTSFVDVWTSINAFDFYDRQGSFHSRTETLRHWGESFKLIRETFAGGPTISEAGSDQLIGWLEGADCQFLQISREGADFNLSVPCDDWARVPWFDVVNHARFSLHGVGYSSRYQGGRSRAEHGIDSDDYISTEILTGHALMTDRASMVRRTVRKYWLAQDFIESIALDDIVAVRCADGDLHRQVVDWKSGARVWVNRSQKDWRVEDRLLPPYGYLARNGAIESSIERIGLHVVEQSRSSCASYANARRYDPDAPLRIRPAATRIEHRGGRDFRLIVDWEATGSAPKDLMVFYHFSRTQPGRYSRLEYAGGGRPEVPTSRWLGRLTTGGDWDLRLPEHLPPGDYEVLVGLYDNANGRRYRLYGHEDPDRRYRVGTLTANAEVATGRTNVTGMEFAAAPAFSDPLPQPETGPVQLGPVTTTGGLKIDRVQRGLRILPLPDGDDFEVSINLGQFRGNDGETHSLQSIDSRGKVLRRMACRREKDTLTFTAKQGDFGYLWAGD